MGAGESEAGALNDTGAGEAGVGVGRWVRLTGDPEVAEIAITVVDDFHRKGLGRTLLYLCATTASAKGIRTFKAWVLGENTKTLRMLAQVGAAQKKWEGGVMEATLPVHELVARPDLVPLPLTPVQMDSQTQDI
jgi:GNAT superfamily N-acetyltransferase